jgi:acyl carrier protein
MEQVRKEDTIRVLKGMNMNADVEALDPSVDLASQGIDSLDMMNMLFEFEEAFSIKITDDSIDNGEWLTIDKIVKNINELVVQKDKSI